MVRFPQQSTALRALVGLLHFRIRWEDPKKRGSLPQCFRCLEFGHHANFCKQQVRCRTCAETHDSRECPAPTSHPPKCHNCQGDHLASSKDCPHRQRLLTSVRRPPIPKPPPAAEFPPLHHTSPTSPVSSDSSRILPFFAILRPSCRLSINPPEREFDGYIEPSSVPRVGSTRPLVG